MNRLICTLLLFCSTPFFSEAQIITTIAGNGNASFNGDGGPDSVSVLNYPSGVAFDRSGNIYIADYGNNRIRKINITDHIISTVAGNGTTVFAGDNGAAILSSLNHPSAVAIDSAGNLFVADTDNERIRRIDAGTQIITTIAGNGISGFNGDNIQAIAAQLNKPTDIALDSAGNIYIADQLNHRIRKINKDTRQISTIAGNGIQGYDGDGDSAIFANLNSPAGVCVDKAGNILIADQGNNAIRKVTRNTGFISKVAGNYGGFGFVFSGDGGLGANAVLFNPTGVTTDTLGNIYIADNSNNVIRKINAVDNIINSVAGTGGFFNFGSSGDNGLATNARLYAPSGIGLDETGNIYIADFGNHRIRKVTIPCIPSTYTFTGNGNWSDKANWLNQRRPPPVLAPCGEIFIDNTETGECYLNVQQVLLPGAKITVADKKRLKVPMNIGVH